MLATIDVIACKKLANKPATRYVIKNQTCPNAFSQLSEIIMKLNLNPVNIVRSQEEQYRKELKGKKFTDIEWIKILVENPKIIERPIVVARHKAVIAQPPDKADELL